MFALLPIWSRILIAVVGLGGAWSFGDLHGHAVEGEAKDLVIARQQHVFDERIHVADAALAAANARATAASQGATTDQATITAAYLKGKTDAAPATNARVADFAAGRQRMRVDAVCRPPNAGGGSAVPGPAAASSGTDAPAVAGVVELRPDAAGRVEAAAAQVNDLARQVIALQALAQSEHDRCNQVSAAPPREPTTAEKRTVLRLGAPNPFDH